MGQGVTKPLYAFGDVENDIRVQAVAKFCSHVTHFNPSWMAREMVGVEFARLCGLNVPEAYLLELLSETADELARTHQFEVYGNWCLGSHKTPYLGNIFSTTDVYKSRDVEAQLLIVVDMLTLNDDRTSSNPNLAFQGNKLFAFDFGATFPTLGSTDRDFDRSLSSQHLQDIYSSHVAHPRSAVSGTEFDWAINQVFSQIEPGCDMIQELAAKVPEEFQEALDTSYRYLSYIRKNEEEFRDRVRRVL